ncbi:MAG: nitronate monooxygenase [Bacteriovoracaceae bacterium]|nr:nitronate monooxygenase [Bacteriovoracaceae bacterium]
MINTWLTKTFDVKHPIILAPMFLVSNVDMMVAASKAGILGCTPALNWRTPEEFDKAMEEMKDKCQGPFGINLITNKSNVHLKKQLEICEDKVPDFVITSLGSPQECIERLAKKGCKVICDVVDLDYAKKVEDLGADALIAVNSGAGGHAGRIPAGILVPTLIDKTNLPVISAGGVGTGAGLLSILSLGAEGVSMGTPFIASSESGVNADYKKAIMDYGAKDIVLTSKISGSPCTVIKTPYLEKIGTDQNVLEKVLNSNKKIKKYAKMLTFYKGMKLLEQAAFGATYKSVWCAGPSLEFVDKEEPIQVIVDRLVSEFDEALKAFNAKIV